MKLIIDIIKRIISKPTLIFLDQISLKEPIIFVANHEKNYGPIVMQLFFPVSFRPWIIYNMLDAEFCQPYVQEAFFEKRLGCPSWLSRLLSRALARFLTRLMHYTNPVPVYRDKPDQIIETFRQSVEALDNGERLLIFPENGDGESFSPEVKEFYNGFIYLAKLYYRNTKKCLLFCPVSINPRSQTISVGRMIRFNPAVNFDTESERIRVHLMQQIAILYHHPWIRKEIKFKKNYIFKEQELQSKATNTY